jgi:hypothetical protein
MVIAHLGDCIITRRSGDRRALEFEPDVQYLRSPSGAARRIETESPQVPWASGGLFHGEATAQGTGGNGTNPCGPCCAERHAFRAPTRTFACALLLAAAALGVRTLRFEIKFGISFSPAIACKITKIVDYKQQDHLKTHYSAARNFLCYQQVA